MTAVPLDREGEKDVRALTARVRATHEPMRLVEGDEAVAFLVPAEEYEALLETLDILSNPGEVEDVKASREEFARGEGIDGPRALAPYLSKPPRPRPE